MSKKSNLFNFVTLRNPQLLDEDQREQGFIEYNYDEEDQAEASYFHNASTGSGDQRYDNLIARAEDLKNDVNMRLLSRKALKSFNSDLYTFSMWLAKNKNSITVANVTEMINATYDEGVGTTILHRLWDNLVYQTITGRSKGVRDALIKMIVGNAFIAKFQELILTSNVPEFTPELEKEFKRRANANVVVPSRFLPDLVKNVPAPVKLSSALTERLNDEMMVAMAEENRKYLVRRIDELREEERADMIQHSANFDSVYREYIDAVRVYKANPDNRVVTTRTLSDGTTEDIISYPNLNTDIVFERPVLSGSAGSVTVNSGAGSQQAEQDSSGPVD